MPLVGVISRLVESPLISEPFQHRNWEKIKRQTFAFANTNVASINFYDNLSLSVLRDQVNVSDNGSVLSDSVLTSALFFLFFKTFYILYWNKVKIQNSGLPLVAV